MSRSSSRATRQLPAVYRLPIEEIDAINTTLRQVEIRQISVQNILSTLVDLGDGDLDADVSPHDLLLAAHEMARLNREAITVLHDNVNRRFRRLNAPGR